jgi:hypothetical protein
MQNVEWRMQKGGAKPTKANLKPGTSQLQARRLGSALLCSSCAPLVLLLFSSCVALVLLLCCSCSPLVLRWCPPPRHGGSTDPVLRLDGSGSAVIQTGLHFPVNLLAHAVPRPCQGQRQSVAQASSPAGFGSVPAPRVEASLGGTPGQLAGEDSCATLSMGLRGWPGLFENEWPNGPGVAIKRT